MKDEKTKNVKRGVGNMKTTKREMTYEIGLDHS